MRERVAAWLRQNEQQIVPGWIKLVRSRGSDRDRQSTTKELARQFFTDFYHAFLLTIEEGGTGYLETVLDRIAVTRVEEEFQLEDTLDIFFLLKELIWEQLSQTYAAEATLSRMFFLEPIFDQCLRLLSRSFTRASSALLAKRLVEAEFMTRRLAMATEEADRALSRLRILYNISRAISSTLNLKQILVAVAENLSSVPQIDRCAVWLADKAACELSVVAAQGIEAEKLNGAYLLLQESQSVLTRAFKLRQMQLSSVPGPAAEALSSLFPQRTVLVVPLLGEEQPIGVISVDRLGPERPLETAVIEMVQSVASQTAIAVRNTQLYEELVQLNQDLERRVQERTEELARLNREMAKLDRKKSDFVAIAAHELKTPLTLIQGYAEMLAENNVRELPPESIERVVSGIVKGTSRLRTIVEDIIDVSLIDTEVLSLSLEMSSLSNIMDLARQNLQESLVERKQTLVVSGFDDLPYIEADSLRLHQVLVNVIGNAIKYTPDGGRIEVTARHLEAQAGQPAFIEIVVADNGVGIDVDEQERIFDKFYRVEGPELHSSSKSRFMGAGPGLGLTIAKGIVEAHGGRIWVESPGYDPIRCPGSKFHILLPLRSAWGQLETRAAE